MSTTEHSRWQTVGSILLGESTDSDDPTDPVDTLARSFNEHGVVRSGVKGFRHLSGAAMRAVSSQLAEVLLTSLNLLDVRELLVNGWSKHKDLREAAARTHAVPGSEELVTLATHRIDSTHQPSIDLIVQEATVHTCVFDVTVEFDLNGVMAVVRQGMLTALRGGTCVITARLALGAIPLVPPQQRRIDLVKFINLNPGVRLLDQTAPSSSTTSQPHRPDPVSGSTPEHPPGAAGVEPGQP